MKPPPEMSIKKHIAKNVNTFWPCFIHKAQHVPAIEINGKKNLTQYFISVKHLSFFLTLQYVSKYNHSIKICWQQKMLKK